MSESGLSDDVRAYVGKEVGPGEPLTVYQQDVERFARVVGETSPMYFDDEAASRSIFGGRPMPLAYPLTNFASGTERDFNLPLGAKRRLRGGDELIVNQPVLVGDTLRARTRLLDIEEKSGQSSKMAILKYETEYINQREQVCMVVRTTIIMR
ncbi:MAG: MaoC family dehydratase N-terminal domain-containing protein [Chloroflexi bacterium]|nr:MaoC family dehydratase N-terminal domain-containing protein [Chloroflexota bacterium]